MERPMVVLPQPDSPTTPTHSPPSTWKVTSSTATTLALFRRNSVRSPSISRIRLTAAPGEAPAARTVSENPTARIGTLTRNGLVDGS